MERCTGAEDEGLMFETDIELIGIRVGLYGGGMSRIRGLLRILCRGRRIRYIDSAFSL